MDVTPEPDTSLEIETTSLADEAPSPVDSGVIDGLERTVDFAETQASAAAPSLRDEEFADDVEPLADLEPTAAIDQWRRMSKYGGSRPLGRARSRSNHRRRYSPSRCE